MKNTLRYYKKSALAFLLWYLFFLSYNYYFGFNIKSLSFIESCFDIFSQIQLFIVVMIYLSDRDRAIHDDFLIKTGKILEKYYLIKKDYIDFGLLSKEDLDNHLQEVEVK